MSIKIINVTKTFNAFKVLDQINLKINTGELVALLGSSGAGKTTLLRIIAGLETPDNGIVIFDGEDHTGNSLQDRKVSFVCQHYALCQHFTVFENIACGIKERVSKLNPTKEVIREKVSEILDLVKMQELGEHYPSQLSREQRQRIALGKAVAAEPKVLLVDEPSIAFRGMVRKDLLRWLRRLHDVYPITSIFATHDQKEAFNAADKIVILNQGKIEQIGTPEEVYRNPVSPFVYNFSRRVNISPDRGQEKNENVFSHAPTQEIKIKLEKEIEEFVEAEIIFISVDGEGVHLVLKELDETGNSYVEMVITKESFKGLNLKMRQKVYLRSKDFEIIVPENYDI